MSMSARRITVAAYVLALLTPFTLVLIALSSGVEPGFPLDDAWIHQVFGRSLAETGTFAFNEGEPSTGSTSPLWTLTLAAGFLLPIPRYVWTLIMGGVSLTLVAAGTSCVMRRVAPTRATLASLAALAIATEWHLVWAAAAGMETALFVALTLFLMATAADERPNPLFLGTIGGLAILARAEGAVLLAIALVARLVFGFAHAGTRTIGSEIGTAVAAGTVAGVILLPYVIFSLLVSGTPLPNTFAAKTAFYGRAVDLFFAGRFVLALIGQLAVSPILALAPLGLVGVRRPKETPKGIPPVTHRAWFVMLVWSLALPVLYLIRLPVIYQHARYYAPLFPVLLIAMLSVAAVAYDVLRRPFLRRSVAAIVVAMWIGMWWVGAMSWLSDVRFINAYQVAAGRWIASHSAPESTVATHDVGAVRYFGQRRIVDLAGLMTPEVIPIVRDGTGLRGYAERQRVEYVIAFPDWVPGLTDDPRLHEVTRFWTAEARAAGSSDMVIYQADWR